MQVTEHTAQLARREFAETSHSRYVWVSVLTALMSTLGSIMAAVLSVFIVKFPKSFLAELFSTGQRLSFFIGALLLFAIVIVIFSTFRIHQSRSVNLLKNRLAEIYLSALKKSSLNPQLESPTRHD